MSEFVVSNSRTPLNSSLNLTPVQDELPNYIEKSIRKSAPALIRGSSHMCNTPKLRNQQNKCAKYKIRPRVLYEEVNKVNKIIERKKLAQLLPQCKWIGRDAIIVKQQPMSLKYRRQMYIQSRLREKRKQRKQFELTRRIKSQDEIICHFRDMLSDQIETSVEN